MTPEQATDARRRKKAELERQLAALDEEDRYVSKLVIDVGITLTIFRYYAGASQQPPKHHRHREPATYTASSSSHYPSRNDAISPPWPQTATSASSLTGWRTAPVPSGSNSSGHSQRLAVQSSYQPIAATSSHSSTDAASSQAPWTRSRPPSLANSNPAAGPNNTYTPSPNSHARQPLMPNPFSPTFINIPVPSKEQVEVYLIRAQGQPLGLRTGWTINNHSFDVYDLFLATTRLGGSKAVNRRQWWPEMADILGIPAVNTPQGPDINKTGHQLQTFFTTHLGALEEMWERTSGTAEDAGDSYSTTFEAHSRSHLLRIPPAVSSARGGHNEEIGHSFTRTYPPQPPPPREQVQAASTIGERSSGRSGVRSSGSIRSPRRQRQPPQSSSVPLHVNPSDISTRRATDIQSSIPPSGSSYDQSQQHLYASEQSYPTSQPQHITQFTGISPTLHHPAPSSLAHEQTTHRLDQHSSVQTQETSAAASQAGSSSQATESHAIGSTQQASQAGPSKAAGPQKSATKSTATSFPSLSNYTPPKFASFDDLVQTNALRLPKLPPNVHLDYVGGPSEIFAKRCFELRSVVKKIQAKLPARHISAEEMTFWQKLCQSPNSYQSL